MGTNARRIATKLVATAALSSTTSTASFQTVSSMSKGSMRINKQMVPRYVSDILMIDVEESRQRKIDEGLVKAMELLSKNRIALKEIVKKLLIKNRLSGYEVK